MKLYLASTAPGHEGNEVLPAIKTPTIPNRLLSYHHVIINAFGSNFTFKELIRRRNESKNRRP